MHAIRFRTPLAKTAFFAFLSLGLVTGIGAGRASAATTSTTTPPPPASLAVSTHYTYVLSGNTLCAFTSGALTPVAKATLPPPPAQSSSTSSSTPPPPAILAASDAGVYVIAGQNLLAFNPLSLTLVAHQSLPKPPSSSSTSSTTQAPPPPPGLSADATHVYILLGKTIYTFDAGTLSPLGQKDLPTPPAS